MKKRSFTITGNMSIHTRNGIITEGREYFFKEGRHILKVIVEKVLMVDGILELQVYWPEWNRREKITRVYDNIGYTGMWRIFDLDDEDLDFWYGEEVMRNIRQTPVDKQGSGL